MDLHAIKFVHLIGAGGINMSAVAKLLLKSGASVSGSDLAPNDQTEALKRAGAEIKIGESAEHIPENCGLIITTSAAPATNKERVAAAARGIPEMTNFAFLGQWFESSRTVVVAGTHGKSTTTAMLGLMLEKAGFDPTVVVGSKVPAFAEGNLRLGNSDVFVVEGDEYARHFLEFRPYGVVLNNLELDHTDVFSDISALIQAFHELLDRVQPDGVVVANVKDERIARLVEDESTSLERKGVRLIRFGTDKDGWRMASDTVEEHRRLSLEKDGVTYRFDLSVPGEFNAWNAAGAVLMSLALGAKYPEIAAALESFKGIWRRFEFLGERNGVRIYSDYGHHPTAVAATLKAARESFKGQRVLLCFQPHHRNRTKSLFNDFISSCDEADVLVLCEIYDVAGRDKQVDTDVNSRGLVEAVLNRDRSRQVSRSVEYASGPESAVERILAQAVSGDVVICMGAGDIDGAIRAAVSSPVPLLKFLRKTGSRHRREK